MPDHIESDRSVAANDVDSSETGVNVFSSSSSRSSLEDNDYSILNPDEVGPSDNTSRPHIIPTPTAQPKPISPEGRPSKFSSSHHDDSGTARTRTAQPGTSYESADPNSPHVAPEILHPADYGLISDLEYSKLRRRLELESLYHQTTHSFEMFSRVHVGPDNIDRSQVGVRRTMVKADEVPDWLQKRGPWETPASDNTLDIGHVRLLIQRFQDEPTKFKFHQKSYEEVMLKLGIPHAFLSIAEQEGPAFRGPFYYAHHDSGRLENTISFIMHNPRHSILPFTLAISWNPQTRDTTGILNISTKCPIHLEKAMTDAWEIACHPLLIPTIFFAEVYSIYHGLLVDLAKEISEIELALRSRVSDGNGKSIDYKSLMHAINSIEGCIMKLELQRTIRTFQTGIQNALVGLSGMRPNRVTPKVDNVLRRYMQQQIEEPMELRDSYLLARLSFQKSLLANICQQQESHLNLSIAKDTRHVALESKRDSSAMKTLAVLSIIFLPSTFVASLFSMSMFDFSPSSSSTNPATPQAPSPESGASVSSLFWMYWVISIPLTVMIIAIWRLWLHYRMKATRKQDEAEGLKFDEFPNFAPKTYGVEADWTLSQGISWKPANGDSPATSSTLKEGNSQDESDAGGDSGPATAEAKAIRAIKWRNDHAPRLDIADRLASTQSSRQTASDAAEPDVGNGGGGIAWEVPKAVPGALPMGLQPLPPPPVELY